MSSKSPIQPGNSKTRQSSLPLGLPIGSLGSLPDLSKLMHETASPWYKFKLFVLQTKVLESGVGVVLGKAFQEFVRSFLNDLLAPPILYIFQNNATQRFLVIKQGRTPKRRYRTVEEAGFDGALTINYGKFGHSCVNFFVVGLSVYYFLNVMKTFFQAHMEHSRKCPFCISDIPAEASRCPQCTSHVDPVSPRTATSVRRGRSVTIEDHTADWFDASEMNQN